LNNEDARNKKNALFDLNSSQFSAPRSTISDNINPISRPQTSDNRKEDPIDSIGEINLAHSRRRNMPARQANRPFTSPGILEGKLDDDKNDPIYGGATDTFEKRPLSKDKDGDSDEESEYLSAIMSRNSRQPNKTLAAARNPKPTTFLDIGNVGNTISNADTPKRSPTSQNNDKYTTKDAFFPAANARLIDEKESTITRGFNRRGGDNSIVDPTGTNIPMTQSTNTTVDGRKTATRKDYLNSKLDEQLNPNKPTLTTGGVSEENRSEFRAPMHHEINNTGLKEAEQYYKRFIDELKTAHSDERRKLEDVHQKELELLRKEKQILIENLENSITRERDRLKELHIIEIEGKDRMHKYELERQKHVLEEQNEGLKRQLEAQVHLNALADEIKYSSNKLVTLSDKMQSDKSVDDVNKKQELLIRERQLKELEIRLRHEQELLDNERRRYEKMRLDLDAKESEIVRHAEKEKELLRQEYSRLTELQSSIRNSELDKRKEITIEKENLDALRLQLEKEGLKIKEEYNNKYRDLEVQMTLFDQQKQQFNKIIQESENELKKKHEEVDNVRKRATLQEADCLRKLKNTETKEMQITKTYDELQTKVDIFNMEKANFEKEKYMINEIATKTKEESESINRFKRDFDTEKERNQRMKMELDYYAQSLQSEKLKHEGEKSNIAQMQKILENLRYGYVKDMTVQNMSKTFNNVKPTTAEPPKPTLNEYYSSQMPPKPITHQRSDSLINVKSTSTAPNFFKKNMSEKRGPSYPYERASLKEDRETRRDTVQPPKSAHRDSSGARGFNLNMFMDQLKTLDQASNVNQNYITKEKENLLKVKLDNEIGHLNKMRSSLSSGMSGIASPLSSAKLYSASGASEKI
jgi:hypothetical protein